MLKGHTRWTPLLSIMTAAFFWPSCGDQNVPASHSSPLNHPVAVTTSTNHGHGDLRVSIGIDGMDSNASPNVWLRKKGSDSLLPATSTSSSGRGSFEFIDLPAGDYELAWSWSATANRPSVYTYHEFRHTADDLHMKFDPPGGNSQIALVVEEGCPPLFLVVTERDVELPSELREVQKVLGNTKFPRGLLTASISQHLEDNFMPLLPAGDYRAWIVANDWQKGDPEPALRSIELLLLKDRATILQVGDKGRRLFTR